MEDFLDFCISKEPLITKISQGDSTLNPLPKLKRFDNNNAKFDRLRFYASGKEGYVFRFRHGEKDLCFKLFKDWRSQAIPWLKTDPRKKCPFANECRAFARLYDCGYNGTWAVQCYGWVYLTEDQFASCAKLANLADCSRLAIVKDFIQDPVRPEHGSEIRKNFQIPKRIGIMPGDIHERNYRASLIVDLGGTMTSPFYNEFESSVFYDQCQKLARDWW